MRSIRTVLFVTLALVSFVSAAFAASLSDVVNKDNAVLDGDILTIKTPVEFRADGTEIKTGKVVLPSGASWEFQLASNQWVDLNVQGGVFQLTPMGVGKFASLRKEEVPQIRTKGEKSEASVPTIVSKSAKTADKKADGGAVDLKALSLKRSGTRTAKKAVAPKKDEEATEVKADHPTTAATSEIIPEVEWVKLDKVKGKPSDLEGKGTRKNPYTFRDLMRISTWMHAEQGWKFTATSINPGTENSVYFRLTGRQIKNIDYVEWGKPTKNPVYSPKDKYTIGVFIASFYPYRAETDPDNAIEINVGDLYTNLDATVSLFGRKMEAGNGGYAIIVDKPIKLVGTLPKYAKLDSQRRTYIAGEAIDEVILGNGQFTRWADIGKPTSLVDTQSVEATRKAIRPTKLSHLRSMFFSIYAVRKDKKQWVTQVGEDAVIYVPKNLGKTRVASVNYDNGGRTGTALPGEHFVINKGGQCTWNFNHAVNP